MRRRDADATQAEEIALGAALIAARATPSPTRSACPPRPEPAHAALAEPGATFVTLRQGGELRGCIGTLEAAPPARRRRAQHAQAAAFRDPRFAPLREDEFAALEVEVSLLGRSEPLPSPARPRRCARLRPASTA